jgi:hypothetical protein
VTLCVRGIRGEEGREERASNQRRRPDPQASARAALLEEEEGVGVAGSLTPPAERERSRGWGYERRAFWTFSLASLTCQGWQTAKTDGRWLKWLGRQKKNLSEWHLSTLELFSGM